ncbi:hypothetical protein GWI33_020877 [Rhynchophorus ferrugineus]|uniref:Survival of motor neuron-related-splicing factor 30 n=1 Tax=Rhynchophorus ferrugineus TaxID=354439 RepID=A0A834HNV3_RHYFE|nr:hypothetical protein GWI33_020877 [Rhynchophorus ferrugineus]
MSDELQNYQLQLQQVEAALLSDPNNEELKKLKVDLEEVIELTLDLKNKAEEAANLPEYTEPVAIVEEEDEITRSLLAVEEFVAQNKNKKIWRVGDVCMAKWSEDGQYYEAKIDVINPNGTKRIYWFKELEEEREVEKKKWLAFANKAIKTKKSGLKTRSIFASPDTVNGRVGIGTCGISGKPMTEFATAEKWRKGV